eukprot:GHVP01055042.1.p1 GENE.GHVP01055042.1~~GHVP01055042.1.p1  ORF type:complete len:107 (+),score=11.80 GHVP01055042.1:286-606(+)
MTAKVQKDHYELPSYLKGHTVLHFHFPNTTDLNTREYFQVGISNCMDYTKEHRQNQHCPDRQCLSFGIRFNPESSPESGLIFKEIVDLCKEILGKHDDEETSMDTS